jgi:VanZ family protein
VTSPDQGPDEALEPRRQPSAKPATPPGIIRDPRAWLAVYAVVLALIAFWPTHVDEGMGPFLQAVTAAVPILTYPRIEFGANILLFVPLGVLLMLILRQRYLIMPIALTVTVSIESIQSLMGPARTASVHDVLANTTGAAVGTLVVAATAAVARRQK